MAQTQKEIFRNTILIKMNPLLDAVVMEMLNQAIIEALYNVDVVEMQTLPATRDNTNEYIVELFKLRKAPKLSEKSVVFYLDTVRSFTDFINKSLIDVTDMDVEMYLRHYQRNGNNGKGNAPTTVNNSLKVLRAFFTWMRKSNLITTNPCESIEKYKQIEKPIEYLEDWEFEALRDACKKRQMAAGREGYHECLRDRAMIEVLRSTAVRVGEFISIDRNNIDWSNGNVIVYGEKTRKYRTVCLDDTARYYLKKYVYSRTDTNPALFVSVKAPYERLHRSGVRVALKEIGKRADLERRIYPHLFRKTTATNMVRKGCPRDLVAFYLGHADGNTKTLNKHYAATDPAQITQAFWQYGAAA